jgi:hypothetical protein
MVIFWSKFNWQKLTQKQSQEDLNFSSTNYQSAPAQKVTLGEYDINLQYLIGIVHKKISCCYNLKEVQKKQYSRTMLISDNLVLSVLFFV